MFDWLMHEFWKCAVCKGAAGVDPGGPGLNDPEFIQVDLDVEASRSTGSGFGSTLFWSGFGKALGIQVIQVDPILTFPFKAWFCSDLGSDPGRPGLHDLGIRVKRRGALVE